MFDAIRRFFLGDKRELTRVVESSLLGRLSFNDGLETWESVANIQGQKIKFLIAGDWGKEKSIVAPSEQLISEVENVVLHFDEFSRAVGDFINDQIGLVPSLGEWVDELKRLKISRIGFFWAERPKDGELIFSYGDPSTSDRPRIWACAIKDGKPAPALSFSS